jgi:hypothetical protein
MDWLHGRAKGRVKNKREIRTAPPMLTSRVNDPTRSRGGGEPKYIRGLNPLELCDRANPSFFTSSHFRTYNFTYTVQFSRMSVFCIDITHVDDEINRHEITTTIANFSVTPHPFHLDRKGLPRLGF